MCTTFDNGRAVLEPVLVVAVGEYCDGLRTITLRAPRVARRVLPGQFVHLRLVTEGLTLRRPLSVYRADGDEIEIIYHVVGAGTRILATRQPGDAGLDVMGPLGRPWPLPAGIQSALLVGGGVGSAPLAMLASQLRARGVSVTALVGAQTADRLVGQDAFEQCGSEVLCATDDGSRGHCGLVTEPLVELLAGQQFDVAYVCGPEVMQERVAARLIGSGVPTWVSLERRMACGVGACLSCVVPTVSGLKRACIDGPVFDAEEVLWDEAAASRG